MSVHLPKQPTHPHSVFLAITSEREDGRLMLLQANPKHGLHLLGGKMEDGETPLSALHRELSEEMGLEFFTVEQLAALYSTTSTFQHEGRSAKVTVYTLLVSRPMIYHLMLQIRNAEFDLVVADCRALSSKLVVHSSVANFYVEKIRPIEAVSRLEGYTTQEQQHA